MNDSPLERLKKAGFTSSPLTFERVQKLQEQLDLHVKELGELMGAEWVVLTAYCLGEASAARGLAADLLGEVARELQTPGLQAPGARVELPPNDTKPSARPHYGKPGLPGVLGAKKRPAKKKRGKRS